MNEVTLPPSPNWYLNNILACGNDGTVAWGARNSIVIARSVNQTKILKYSVIGNAHLDRVTCVAFSPEYGQPEKNFIVSGGDEHIVRIWDLDTLKATSSQEYIDKKQKVVAVDWSKCKPDLICFVSMDGVLVCWTLTYNACQQISLGKLTATCLACSPHKSNIVAIGAKNGLVYIVNTQGNGSVNYKLRGHDVEITSLSWCPTEVNIFSDTESKDMLLASGAKDRSIFIWRAGGDGRNQVEIALPAKPMDSNQHRVKLGPTGGNWTAVCWAEPRLLFASSSWGELISWDLRMGATSKPMCKIQHAIHARGLFCISHVPKKVKSEEENWREPEPLTVWTLAQDRQVIRCLITAADCKIEYSVPTQGGYVYCMAICPLDTSRIAFGVGDAMLRLWNLSELHETSFDVTTIWQKVMGKVRSLAWHPEKENLLAFGTGEGRVGICDVNTNKAPTLYRQYHRQTVYSIGWGPDPDTKNIVLYSCGDGELVYYALDKTAKEATCVVKKDCTEFAWKPDLSCMAVGYESGSISIFDRNLKEVSPPIYSLKKAIQCFVWHPDSTATDLNLSPLRNYLAVAINAPAITIFDLTDVISTENAEHTNELEALAIRSIPQPKVVATLCGHVEKVVSLAWSSHFSGYLISGSYDCTAQVWKVETQELIASYTGHIAPVQSCIWSPLDPDYIITGSSDFTVRVWKVSDQTVVIPTGKPQVKRSGKKNKNKKAVVARRSENVSQNDTTTATMEPLLLEKEETYTTPNSTKKDCKDSGDVTSQKYKKERQKKCSYLAAYSKRQNDKSFCLQSLRTLAQKAQTNLNSPSNGTDTESHQDFGNDPCIFGSSEEISAIFEREDEFHASQGHFNVTTEMSLWNNSLRKKLQDATRDKRLNDYLVSLSTSLSMKTWQATCEAYAMQLISESNPTKAVSYLLCIHKIHQAIEILLEQKMYREAYVLARSKLDAGDPMLKRILEDWASNAAREGNFEDAAQCYAKLGDFGKAARLIGRRRNLDSLEVAAELGVLSDEAGVSESLADQAFTEALLAENITAARGLTEKFSQIAHRVIQLEVFEEMKKAVRAVNLSTDISTWLESKAEYGLLEALRTRISKYSSTHSYLSSPNPNSTDPDNEAMLWLVVSHHFAMAAITSESNEKTKQIVTALGAVSQYEIVHPGNRAQDADCFLLRVLSVLEPESPMNEESLFAKKEDPIYMSLRSYLCYALLDHIAKGYVEEPKHLDVVLELIAKTLEDALHPNVVKYWNATNEINKLETALASTMGVSQKLEDGVESKEQTEKLLRQLDRIRNEKKQFLEERVCAPSPILAYSKASEMLNRITDEVVKEKFTKIFSETWSKAIS